MSTRKTDIPAGRLASKLIQAKSGTITVESWMYRDNVRSGNAIVEIRDDGILVATVSVRVPYPRRRLSPGRR